MNDFKTFNIKPNITSFVGDKIPVKKILNTQIKVLDFRIMPSTAIPGTECLWIQIEKSADEKRVVFTGSKILMNMIKLVPEDGFPFITTIKGDNDYYEFT